MTRKVKAVLLSVFALAMSSSAQFTPTNARIESMADIFIIDDISYVFRYAAKMNQYKDDIQVTFPTPMLGIKSFGENVTAGAYVRNGLMLDQSNAVTNFYALGRTALNTAINPLADITSDPTYIPHLLFGMSAGGMNIGVDLFYEWARTRFSDEFKSGTSAAPITATTKQSATLYNPGVIGSIQLGVQSVPVLLKAGVGFPRISGKSKITNETATGTTTTETKIKSESGLFLEFGGEAGIPVLGATLTPGIDFITESYAFKANNVEAANKFRNNRIAAYAGITKKAFTNGLWSALYQVKMNTAKNDLTASDSAIDQSVDTLRQILSIGAENGWDSVWIFSKVYVRGGIGLSATTPFHGAESDTADLNEKGQTIFRPFPTIGIGVTKGIFDLDAKVDLSNWAGLISGPSVMKVTGTLRF
jgi:hypothetical protein